MFEDQLTGRKSSTDKAMTSQRRGMYFRLSLSVLLLAAVSSGLVQEEGRAGDVMITWSMSCSEAQVRCHVDITCRVLLETIDKVCDRSGTIQRRRVHIQHHYHHHHHHHGRVAGEGRRVVAPPCPRSTARLQSSPIGRVESFRGWSSQLFRGRPGGRRHVRSGGRLYVASRPRPKSTPPHGEG